MHLFQKVNYFFQLFREKGCWWCFIPTLLCIAGREREYSALEAGFCRHLWLRSSEARCSSIWNPCSFKDRSAAARTTCQYLFLIGTVFSRKAVMHVHALKSAHTGRHWTGLSQRCGEGVEILGHLWVAEREWCGRKESMFHRSGSALPRLRSEAAYLQ